MIAILKEQESGVATADRCRRPGIGSATFCTWTSKFGGVEVSEARRLRALADESPRLKRLLAGAMRDNAVPRDVAGRKWCRPTPGSQRWPKLESLLPAAARTGDALRTSVGLVLDTVIPTECRNLFTATGYEPD